MQTSGQVDLTFAADYDTSVTAAKFGEALERTVYVHTDRLTADLSVEFVMPSAGSECLLTLHNLHVAAVGKNYPCHQGLQGSIDATSSFGTTQNDALTVELGTVSNLGKRNAPYAT